MPTGPMTAPGRCWRAEIGRVSCQPFSTSFPKIDRSFGPSLVADFWLLNSMASKRSWRRGSSQIGSTGRWAPCIEVFLARDHKGWPCSTGSRMAVWRKLLPGRSGEWASSRRIACRSYLYDSRISRFVRAANSVSLNLKTSFDRGGGCQASASLLAAKNVGFGGGNSGVGAGCSSGDDGVAGATGLPSAGGGNGGGPVVTSGLGLDWRILSAATVSPLLEVLPPVTVVTNGSVMAVSVGEGARFVVV